MNGFLGTGASFRADLNLALQLAMGFALAVGAFLARSKLYTAHAICQSSVLLLNSVLILFLMWPSFTGQVLPALPEHLADSYYAVATAHGMLGGAAELLGLYILLAAGTEVLPSCTRIRRFKTWMRVELVLWWMVIVSGVVTYYVWYLQAS